MSDYCHRFFPILELLERREEYVQALVVIQNNKRNSMIKFFRRIRQQLLTENRISKYLIYALGEIVLVVIGILIALQINNWNTNRQETKTLKAYLHNIASNIEEDQEKLKRILTFRDSSTVGSRYFMTLIDQSPISTEKAAVYFSRYLQYSPILGAHFKANLSSFESLKNSGYLSKIQDHPIEKMLFEYYSLVDEIVYEEAELNRFMEEMAYDLYKNNVIQGLNNIRRKITKEPLSRSEIESP